MSTNYEPNTKHLIPSRSGVAVPLSTGQTIEVINTHGTQVIDFFCFCTTPSPYTSSSPNANGNVNTKSNPSEHISHNLSLPHTRASTCHLSPLPGDILTTNHRLPILEVVSDTTSGVHDTLIAACDIYRYYELEAKRRGYGIGGKRGVAAAAAEMEDVQKGIEELRKEGYWHGSCVQNCRDALSEFLNASTGAGGGSPGMEAKVDLREPWYPPAPLNLFMNIPVHAKVEGRCEVKLSDSPSAGAELSFERPVCGKGDGVVFKALRDVVVVMSACPQDLLEINCGSPRECEFVVRG